jgi:serine/threonine protein kinase
MIHPKKVGEGSYGCVHNPPLKCRNKPYDPDLTKVSKILTRQNANDELKEFKLIQKADKKEDFHLGKPGYCFPDTNTENQTAINQCGRFNNFEIEKYKLLLLKNGGDNLSQIEDKFKKLTLNNTNRIKLEKFWLDMARLIYGSKVLMDNGIVHHDLKQPNIVYNEKTGRVNFIDFGLMTTTKAMHKDAIGSRYPFGEHWSFPPDILFYNYVDYKKLTSRKGKEKSNILREAWKKYMIASAILQDDLMDVNEEISTGIIRKMGAFFRTFDNLTNSDDDYEKYINKSFETFDNYSIGFSLFSLLKATKSLIDEKLFNDLRLLFLSMITFNVFERPSPTEVAERYEFILKSNGLLDKYHMRFDNHFLVKGTEKQEQKKEMEELPKNDKELIEKLILICPPGKERNPKTKRCNNTCKEGYKRDATFKCKRDKTRKLRLSELPRTVSILRPSPVIKNNTKTPYSSQKNKTSHKKSHKTSHKKSHKTSHKKTKKKASLKACIEGKERNPKTRRCVKKCKEGYTRDQNFKCKK